MKPQAYRQPRPQAVARAESVPDHGYNTLIWLVLAVAAGLCVASVMSILI